MRLPQDDLDIEFCVVKFRISKSPPHPPPPHTHTPILEAKFDRLELLRPSPRPTHHLDNFYFHTLGAPP